MATGKRSESKARSGTAGKRKTATRKTSGAGAPKGLKKTSRVRAAVKGEIDMVVAGKRNAKKPPVIGTDADEEIYGVQMSQRARQGESNPRMPEAKVKTTQSKEPKKVPPTGAAKPRKVR